VNTTGSDVVCPEQILGKILESKFHDATSSGLLSIIGIETSFAPFAHPKMLFAAAGSAGQRLRLPNFCRYIESVLGARIVPSRSASRSKTTSKSSAAAFVVPPAVRRDGARSGGNCFTFGKFTPCQSASRYG